MGAARILHRHVSPDGELTFLVEQHDDGDIALGFEGLPWHSHPEVLDPQFGPDVDLETWVAHQIEELLNNRILIAVLRVDGVLQDAWWTDSPAPDRFAPANETLDFRYWNGERVAPE